MKKYFLACFSTHSENGIKRKSHNLDLQVELSNDQWKQLKERIDVINIYIKDIQMFLVIEWNYADLIQLINKYLHASVNNNPDFFKDYPMVININRVLLNLLSSVRSYLDYMNRNLKHRFGIDSSYYLLFEEDRNVEYDTNFSYRFMEQMRNYSQHYGFPIDSFKMSKEIVSEDPLVKSTSINMFFERDALLRDRNFKNEILIEISNMGQQIPVIPHVKSYIDSIKKIHRQTIARLSDTIKGSAEYVIEMSKGLNCLEGNPIVCAIDGKFNTNPIINPIPLPISVCQNIIEANHKS